MTKAKSKITKVAGKVQIEELESDIYWDYRLVQENGKFSIARVDYKNLKIVSWTDKVIADVTQDDLAEFIHSLESVRDAFLKPVLNVAVDGTIVETEN